MWINWVGSTHPTRLLVRLLTLRTDASAAQILLEVVQTYYARNVPVRRVLSQLDLL